MKKPEISIHIVCGLCNMFHGIVKEIPIPNRPGFFENVSDPVDMPTICERCSGYLMRVSISNL